MGLANCLLVIDRPSCDRSLVRRGKIFFYAVFLIPGFRLSKNEWKYERQSIYVCRLICFIVVGRIRLYFDTPCRQANRGIIKTAGKSLPYIIIMVTFIKESTE